MLASFRSSGQISSRSLSPFQTPRTLSVKVLTIRYHPCTWLWRKKLQKMQTRHFHHHLVLIGKALPDSGEDCGAKIPQWSYNSSSNSCQVSFIIIIIIKPLSLFSSPIGTADAVPRPISSAMSSCAESDAAHHPMVGVKP